MATESAAPWAEPVLLTAEDLLALPDDSWRYELVQGRLVRVPPAGFEHGKIELRLARAIDDFVRERGLGTVVVGETGFLVSRPDEPDTVLAPDVAFVSAARLPPVGSAEATAFLRLAPDLVVEVASPGRRRPEMAAKAGMWIDAGVRLVWVVWPTPRQVDVFAPEGEGTGRVLEAADRLNGEPVLPGFTYPVADLFV